MKLNESLLLALEVWEYLDAVETRTAHWAIGCTCHVLSNTLITVGSKALVLLFVVVRVRMKHLPKSVATCGYHYLCQQICTNGANV